MPTNINLPANLPENWQAGQIVSPSGTEVGLSAQHGYNYLMQQVNDTQEAANALSQAVDSQEKAQSQLETDVETLQTDMTQAKSDVETLQTDVGELQTDVGNLQTGQGQLATPNATATHSDSVVAITAPAGVNLISFYAPSDFSGDDTYTVNGSAVTLTDLNGNAVYDGWKEGAPVQLILKGAQAFFKSGGGVNDTLPPLNPNMTMEQADGVFTVTADKLPVAQADALAGAEWYYADHVPARPGDGTKVEFTREQLITGAPEGKAASEYYTGDIVKIKESGVPQEFYVAKHGYPTDGNGRTLLVRRYIYDTRQWHTSAVNAYASCALDSWFENTYYTMFSESVRAMISAVNIPYTPGNGNDTVTTLSRKVFALSVTELGRTASYANVEGSALPIASTLQIAYNSSGSAVVQWTRSPYTLGTVNACCLHTVGIAGSYGCTNTYGARPAFTLPSTALFDPDTNELIEDASGAQTLADTTDSVTLDSGEVITDNGTSISVAIPWTSSSYIYVRQFPYNAKHQYQTQLVGAVATNDPDYGSGPPVVDPVLANNTWEQIAAASEYGIAADTWQVGDTIDILAGAETLTMEIVGFDHDDLADGSGKAGITFGMKNLMANTRQMNTAKTNAGGYTASGMYDYLTTDVFPNLQEDLKAVIKTVNKKTSAGGGSSEIVTTAMQLFNFAEVEIYGTLTWSAPGEGTIYERFVTAESRLKNLANGTGANQLWWERSPRANATDSFCIVHSGDAHANSAIATWSAGVCFGFCV